MDFQLPLELRVGLLLVVINYGYAADVVTLAKIGIDLPSLYENPSSSHAYPEAPWAKCHELSLIWLIGALIWGIQLQIQSETRIWVLSTLAVILSLQVSAHSLRNVLKRIALGGLSAERRLGDILVSDTLVSCSGVLVDLALIINLVLNGVGVAVPVQDQRATYQNHWVLIAASVPLGIRIKQCVIDYRRTKNLQHLLNLGKYLVGNLPHALRVQEMASPDMGKYVGPALFANAVYSLAWDLLVDWKLFKSGRWHGFPRATYIAAGILDTTLRCSFLARSPQEIRIFTLQLLELLRRGGWVILRVESEGKHITESIELPTFVT